MIGLWRRVQHWWRLPSVGPAPGPLFHVACACGQWIQGGRLAHAQAVRCSTCGQEVFVLGASSIHVSWARLQDEPSSLQPGPMQEQAVHPVRRAWLVPAFAGVVTLLIVVSLFRLLLPVLLPARGVPAGDAIQSHLADARRALHDQDLRRARELLEQAAAILKQNPGALAPLDARLLDQLYREIVALAELIPDSPAQILAKWKDLSEEEIQRVFTDLRGRYVLLDLEVSRDAAGSYQFERHHGPELPSLDLRGLAVLEPLPLRERQRVIFAVRWSSIARNATGKPDDLRRWHLTFDPQSGVLLTMPDVAQNAQVVLDEETQQVLRRQAEWAAHPR